MCLGCSYSWRPRPHHQTGVQRSLVSGCRPSSSLGRCRCGSRPCSVHPTLDSWWQSRSRFSTRMQPHQVSRCLPAGSGCRRQSRSDRHTPAPAVAVLVSLTRRPPLAWDRPGCSCSRRRGLWLSDARGSALQCRCLWIGPGLPSVPRSTDVAALIDEIVHRCAS